MSTIIVAIGGSQGVEAFVMTSSIIAPTGRFSFKNLVPYFHPPTQNLPIGFNNYGGGIFTGSGGNLLHGSGGPLGGGSRPSGGGGGLSGRGKPLGGSGAPKWQRTSGRWWKLIFGWKRHKNVFHATNLPMEPLVPIMVSTIGTHYHCGYHGHHNHPSLASLFTPT
jgi:hypothetical protein